jgi:hypothetical protein
MSWRIETANPLALVRELSDGWAQTCFIRPPRDLSTPCLLAILDDVHRVLRDDGTLWVVLPGRGNAPGLIRAIEETGWLRANAKITLSNQARGEHRAVALFSKQPVFHFNPRQPLRQSVTSNHEQACSNSRPSRRGISVPVRRAWCVPTHAGHTMSPRLIEWCILASTSPQACDICGTPWKRLPSVPGRTERWHQACSHSNGRGRCLVFDPFVGTGATVGIAAVQLGRQYLGVEQNAEVAARARRRLSGTDGEAKR